MTAYYVSKDDVLQSVEYFKNLNISNDDMLPLFLLAKHLGISFRKSVKFVSLDVAEKARVLKAIWILGGLQDKNETGEKRSILFPSSFKSTEITASDFYQQGTTFKGLPGRVKDTVEKKNNNVQLFVDNKKILTVSRKYREIINQHYLKDEKISLKHFACWVFRFIDFDFQNTPDNNEFTRVISKAIKNLFNINKNDFLWLFEDDILSGSITPSATVVSGLEIRNEFTIRAGDEPEITPAPTVDPIQSITVDRDQVDKYVQLTGENPSDEQIYKTLLQTKQIVLTGVPGIGKSRFLYNLKSRFDYSEMIQFHANYSYEEFIGGDTIEANSIISKKGKFLDFIEKAKGESEEAEETEETETGETETGETEETEEKTYLFIIDELNRGNIAQIFGETILTLDRGYSVDLPKEIEGIKKITIPNNVYIACSMNSSDRNIAFLDLAIRRRFAFIELQPNYELLSSITEYGSFDLGDILKTINTRILNTLGKEELFLGHSYLLSESVKQEDGKYLWTDESLHLQFNYVILPTLREYTFSNPNALVSILGEPLSGGAIELEDFVEAFREEFGRN